MNKLLLFFLLTCRWMQNATAQDEYAERKFQFLSYEKVPTWTGLASGWNSSDPVIHLFNSAQYPGHADFASKGLKTGVSFKQFKEQVRHPDKRKYLPFFLYDLRQHPVTIDRKHYTWALMLEDYAYEDNSQQMAATTLRLMHVVRNYISGSAKAPAENHGIVVLASGTQVKPNTSAAPLLNQNGYADRTLHELNLLFNAAKTSVLNSGTAYGYLRYIKAGTEDSAQFSPQDIVIYEKLPARVPPVSGIITLEPQTPLSHINLLAKNRGTINLFATQLSDIPGLAARQNKLVKIECSEKKVVVSEASAAEAKKFWDRRVTRLSVPPPWSTVTHMIDLRTGDQNTMTIPHIGAKASNYALILQHFPKYVRPGYAFSFYWYFKTMRQCGADSLVQELVKKKNNLKTSEKKLLLQKIREQILEARLDTALLYQVKKLADEKFPGSRIRLRSSTNCEDLPEFNGAGLYLSKGYNVKDSLYKLEKKILQVYASLWSETAFAEREFYFIDHLQVGMAILINEAYTNEHANGVTLTVPHQEGYSVFINTQAGGELVTNPENGQVPEAILFRNARDTAYLVETRSSIQPVFLSGRLDRELLELKQLTLDVQKLFESRQVAGNRHKYGVDIEFRIMNEGDRFGVYIKQARLLKQVLPQ